MNRISAHFQTSDNTSLNDVIRLLIGLKGILAPSVALDYSVDELAEDWASTNPPAEDDESF